MSLEASSERQFVSTYLELINLAADAPSSNFYTKADVHKVESLGPTLPQLKAPLSEVSGGSGNEEDNVTLSFSSIKPPFKFNSQLESVPANSTIYTVKKQLIGSIESVANAGVGPDDLKLLLKGKVMQDSVTLSSLSSSENTISFKVMITSQPKKQESPKEEIAELDPDVSVPVTLTDSTWEKIHTILKNDLRSEQHALEVIKKFKESV